KIAKIERENEDCLRALCDILAHFAVKALNRQGREEFAKIAKKGEHNGNPNHNITSARSSTDGSVASCIHAVVAGSGAILSPAHARSGRHRLACCVLACDRFGRWQLVPLRRFSRPAALSRLLLSRRADHDCVVHINLYHAVGYRSPQRRYCASGARSIGMDSPFDAHQPADVWRRGTAQSALSGEFDRIPVGLVVSNADTFRRCDVRAVLSDGESPDDETGRMTQVPAQYALFPTINATLNGASAVLLFTGHSLIKRGRMAAHRAVMIAAVISSSLFLSCYLYYHAHVGSVPFQGHGWSRPVYFTILISHTTLAIAIVPLVIITLIRALR